MSENHDNSNAVSGKCSRDFNIVKEEFETQFKNNWFNGGRVSVFQGGECVVDLYSGTSINPNNETIKFDENSLVLVASSTKFVESVCMALLVDRGLLSYDDNIIKYWPEFSQGDNRKNQITIRQLMMHRGGIPYTDTIIGTKHFNDHKELSLLLETIYYI